MFKKENTAFVFSGQGAQCPGMGLDAFNSSTEAAKIFEIADMVRPGTSKQCFEGTKEELSLTENTQPCLLAVDLAMAKACQQAGIEVSACAGFSLGEIAALSLAGAFTTKEAFDLICHRANLMSRASQKHPGAMYAVLGLTDEAVEDICKNMEDCYPVNYNCPGQVVCACTQTQADNFSQEIKNKGGRTRKLAVSGAFHSPFMNEVAEGLKDILNTIVFKEPVLTVYANKTALPYNGNPESEQKNLLAQQASSPVLWTKTIQKMVEDGIDTFIEVGAGKVLCGLIAKINPEVRVLHASEILNYKGEEK